MMSEEECLKALDYLFDNSLIDDYSNDIDNKMYDILKRMIEEHFKPKENTKEYKHFKLHSDSTLKNQTKKELIDYINMLYHNWGVCDEQLAHSLNAYNNLEEKYKKSLEFLEITNRKPYCVYTNETEWDEIISYEVNRGKKG